MASAPNPTLPLLYNELVPLNSNQHGDWKGRATDKAPWVAKQHAIPLTVEEFPLAQRDYPIVFSVGERPVPLALMGLNEGVNVFFNDDGSAIGTPYIPAYIRRYPFLLARLQQDSDNLSLCFDPTSDLVGQFDEGERLFADDMQPSQHTQALLDFCEKFEEAGNRTGLFMEELKKHDLLMDGEISIQRRDAPDQPFTYRGFSMVNQDKLRELRGDQLRTWNQNGLLPLIFAHLFSLSLMSTIFAKQVDMGRGPINANMFNGAAAQPAETPIVDGQ
ncbi:SapC family protein [Aurantiacibacter luteus]|uniref:Multidrug transporter n=1 Tax=Aurantiacibacter luteus TaxID=1581420 RepID=A0A0G9MZ23_9SPHN|nr:SapC family protein [Aurantiacibacter luteus]KLE35794.1 multidrug transporter [Aurantiacibacter luteus]